MVFIINIVCTGYGVIAPNTNNIDQFLSNLINGVCCLDVYEGEGPNNETNILGLIKEELDEDKKLKRLPRVTKLGITAAKEAIESARLEVKDKKVGLFFGISLGAIREDVFQDSLIYTHQDQFRKIPITLAHYCNYHSITAAIGHEIGTNGITKTISTGCTSSLEAIEEAMVYLKSGKIDVAIVGGSDSPICKGTTYGFAKTRVIPLNQSLEEGAVPFQESSKGFAMSEASGVIVLERKEDAVNRGASIRGEIVDIVSNNDGIYIFSLDELGDQMKQALQEVTENRVPDYINSQALGIQINDQIEKRCSKELFDHKMPYTSIKSMYGNPFGVTGILQVIASLLSIEHSFIPPTIRTSKAGYEEMNIITRTKFQEVNEVAITNHGYGGNNACAYIKKCSE
ncbi:beta-ketoacyl synthase N-terminal-like domain-containing protein [Lederbergia citri]|uniref:beta-ketoacyl synthase N-terminal-like domain-containing protein n=1 Tax=Lederbergia citri TaxID=2833580 RepID=UPI002D7F5A4B|nr:beta-ketoacyl synthase N-terminal-like domain-containing protein [Lederbergia citri]